jgi:3-keto-5-aminohexanoate cleavage enzyme
VGMEDNVVFARGIPVEHNSQLVERVAHLAEVMQRPAMSTADARQMLGVKDRS